MYGAAPTARQGTTGPPAPCAASPRRRPASAEALKPEDESNIVFFQISGCLALGQMIIPHQSLTRLFKRFS